MKCRLLSVILCMIMGLTAFPGAVFAEETGDGVSGAAVAMPARGEPVLAYVPLDNRPANVDRVIYEAESAGFKVIMPDADLYATRLDGQPRNSNGTPYGDSEKLMEWIEEADKKADYFVISLDQLLSGGLVNSRTISKSPYYDEYKMIDEIIKLAQENRVYIVDTVVRLASCTVGYEEATLDTYNYLRQYSFTPRRELKSTSLTVNNIVDGYTRDAQSRIVPVTSAYSKVVKESLKVRERKLRLIDYMLTQDYSRNIRYFIGIDDSNPEPTIQTNEVKYIEKKMGDRGLIFSGADELGMMAVLGLMIDYYGCDIKVAPTYFGSTEASSSGSVYDMETVKENLEKHLASLNVQVAKPEEADVEVVVLTAPEKNILNAKYINRMIDYINNNIAKGIPTIVINSAPSAYGSNLEYRMIRECEMSMLLSYSSWNTVGNSIGLALGNGLSRYLYLTSRDSSSDKADIAFLKGLVFSYEKDISYLRGGGKTLFNTYLTEKGLDTSNFYKDEEQVKTVNTDLEALFETSDYNVSTGDILNNLTDRRYFKGLSGECGIIGKIQLSNYSAPFYRTFEIRFDIDVQLSKATLKGFKDALSIRMPYTPSEGQLTYSMTLYYKDEEGKVHKIPCTYDKATGTVQFAADVPFFFTSTLEMEAEKAVSLFADVAPSAWYFDHVLYVYENGLMKGTSANLFSPKAAMTRGMTAYTLYQMAGEPASDQGLPEVVPTDIGNKWYRDAAVWASENGIMLTEKDGSFRPEKPTTREEMANALWKFADFSGLNAANGKLRGRTSYPDALLVSPEFRDGVDWACSNGIMTGSGAGSKYLNPGNSITRAEVAAMLKRFTNE